MKRKACLDTGILTLFFARDCPSKISNVMEAIKKEAIEGHVLVPVLAETFFHICKLEGAEAAKVSLSSLVNLYPLVIGEQDLSIAMSAGVLKCRHRNVLSHVDCLAIAYCVQHACEFHTTEKNLRTLPGDVFRKVKIIEYSFP